MSESLQLQPEQVSQTANLPLRNELAADVYDKILQQEMPVSCRLAEVGETPDYIYYDDSEDSLKDIDTLQNDQNFTKLYLEQAAQAQADSAWWNELGSALSARGYQGNPADLTLNKKHNLTFNYDNESTAQQLAVYEVGEGTVEPEQVATVTNTLELIDQFTGGMLASSPNAPKILIGNHVPLGRQDASGEDRTVLGFAGPQYVFINLQGIQEKAAQYNANPQEILAATVVHEVLGHSTERAVYGSTGAAFEDKFTYSKAMVPGEKYDQVHESITPIDPAYADSRPVREYGETDSGEDVATTVDTSVAQAMNWSSVQNVPNLKGDVDSYRRDIVMDMMDRAAKMVAELPGTPGFVGSEVAYVAAQDGTVMAQPRRTVTVESVDGMTAIHQETEALAANTVVPKELKIKIEKLDLV